MEAAGRIPAQWAFTLETRSAEYSHPAEFYRRSAGPRLRFEDASMPSDPRPPRAMNLRPGLSIRPRIDDFDSAALEVLRASCRETCAPRPGHRGNHGIQRADRRRRRKWRSSSALSGMAALIVQARPRHNGPLYDVP